MNRLSGASRIYKLELISGFRFPYKVSKQFKPINFHPRIQILSIYFYPQLIPQEQGILNEIPQIVEHGQAKSIYHTSYNYLVG